MIFEARETPYNNRTGIVAEGLKLLGLTEPKSGVFAKTGIDVSPNMVTIPAHAINTPTVLYNGTSMQPNMQQLWHPGGHMFFGGTNTQPSTDSQATPESGRFSGHILVLYSQNQEATLARECATELMKTLNKHGVNIYDEEGNYVDFGRADRRNFWLASHIHVQMINIHPQSCANTMRKTINSQTPRPSLVMYKNPTKGVEYADQFAKFKKLLDTELGIHSICISSQDVYKAKITKDKQNRPKSRLPQYLSNVALKANIKLGYVNHSLELAQNEKSILYDGQGRLDTLILGADVNHPQGASSDLAPSIAAVVGGVDDTFGRFLGSVRYQEAKTEIIAELGDMVKDRLNDWYDQNGRVPSNILYYRDGVGESQYQQIRAREIPQIREAYRHFCEEKAEKIETMPEKVNITAVVVTKRHHTRFYSDTRGNENCPVGTCVESGVTHPCYFDFFLQSHKAVAGTAKPSYYFVLENDMNFTPKVLQDFTYALCFTYVRVCLPVSYVPPVYYADRLCDRARSYIKGMKVTPPGKFNLERPKKKKKDESQLSWETRFASWRTAQKEWRQKDHWTGTFDGKSGNRAGPWHPRLNNTMFWM